MVMREKIFILGVGEEKHVGGQLRKAAEKLDLDFRFIDVREAEQGNRLLAKLVWKMAKRPIQLTRFSRKVLALVEQDRPKMVLTTGMAPLDCSSLEKIGSMNVRTINYSTDDPWNPAHRANWFLKALPYYGTVFSTRRANLEEFRDAGVRQVEFLPFGYDPDLYFPDASGSEEPKVFLAGGGDVDRYPLVKALADSGIGLSLWGGYWERAGLKSGGFLDAAGIRREAAKCMVSLVVVRRANRDGSAMRSFEIPACGGCCVVEDTQEHRVMFGSDGEAVLYFSKPEELAGRVRGAFANPELRSKLRMNVHKLITERPNTYADRLRSILEAVEENSRKATKDAKKISFGESGKK